MAGSTAKPAVRLGGVHRNTATYFYQCLRQTVLEETRAGSWELFDGEAEADESCLGGHRKSRRGRGASGKVYTQMVPNVRRRTLEPILEAKATADGVVYTDGLNSYDALDVARFHHCRVNHLKRFADMRARINGSENSQKPARHHPWRDSGVLLVHSSPLLKECEWRFSGSNRDSGRSGWNNGRRPEDLIA